MKSNSIGFSRLLRPLRKCPTAGAASFYVKRRRMVRTYIAQTESDRCQFNEKFCLWILFAKVYCLQLSQTLRWSVVANCIWIFDWMIHKGFVCGWRGKRLFSKSPISPTNLHYSEWDCSNVLRPGRLILCPKHSLVLFFYRTDGNRPLPVQRKVFP